MVNRGEENVRVHMIIVPRSTMNTNVRPRSSVGRVTVDLIRRSWVRFPPRSKDFFFTSSGSLIPFTRANAQWVIHGFNRPFYSCVLSYLAMNASEAGGDLALIHSLLFSCKCKLISIRTT